MSRGVQWYQGTGSDGRYRGPFLIKTGELEDLLWSVGWTREVHGRGVQSVRRSESGGLIMRDVGYSFVSFYNRSL